MDRNERTKSRTNSTTMVRDSKNVGRKILIDFLIVFCVGFGILAFYLWGVPYERGFFCNDESLKHPYKDSTVTNITLYIVGLGMPIISMCLNEWLRLRDYKGGRRLVFGQEVPSWLWEAYQVVGVFLFGCACQQLTTDIAKYTIGRLRPHFFTLCDPQIDCSLPENRWRYIQNFTCRGTAEPKMLKEMRLSFPSGHSSFSAYTMLYFSMYLHKRFSWRGSKLLRHGIQFVLLMMAWYTVMTRVSDYKHHWSDVLAGFAIGLLYAVVIFCFVSDVNKSSRRQHHHDSELATNGNGRSWQV